MINLLTGAGFLNHPQYVALMYTVCVRNSPVQIETSSTTFHDRTFQAIAQIVGSLNLIQPAKDVGGTYGYLLGGANGILWDFMVT